MKRAPANKIPVKANSTINGVIPARLIEGASAMRATTAAALFHQPGNEWLRVSPAMVAGVSDRLWTLTELVEQTSRWASQVRIRTVFLIAGGTFEDQNCFPMPAIKNKSAYLKRAERLRQIAADVRGDDDRKILLEVAREYERIASTARKNQVRTIA